MLVLQGQLTEPRVHCAGDKDERVSLHRNEIGLIYFLFFFVSYSSND